MDYHNEEELNALKMLCQKDKEAQLIFYSGEWVDVIESMVLLIKAGVNVNCTNFDDETPLMKAAHKGYVSRMALLLQAGANIEVINNENQTALSQAIYLADSRAFELLFFIMSNEQLENEIRFNKLRMSISDEFEPNLEGFFRMLMNEKQKKMFKALNVLVLCDEKNPFLRLPHELKRLIYFSYFAVSKKMKIAEYCPVFDGVNMQNVLDDHPKPLMFSSVFQQHKQKREQETEEENLSQDFALLSVEAPEPIFYKKKKKKKINCIIS